LRKEASVADWIDLQQELDLWGEAGRVAMFWWRDDDAHEPNPALMRLLDTADEYAVDVALAAIPGLTAPLLSELLANRRHPVIFQHGFMHRNHAVPGQRAVECGGRAADHVLHDLRRGQGWLQHLFGAHFKPILVPPWNHIASPLVERLAGAGYTGLSAFGNHSCQDHLSSLIHRNTHFDLLKWRDGERFAGCGKVLSQVVGSLQARRMDLSDPHEPMGMLTHHRNHDESAWTFLETILRIIVTHPAASWLTVEEVLGAPAAAS
jgi:hypothetical protein